MKIHKFFFYKTQNNSIAEDLTSETFLSLAEQIRMNTNIDSYQSYLYGIARNKFNDFLKEKYKSISFPTEIIDQMNMIEDTSEVYEDKAKLNSLVTELIDQLPRSQKKVLQLRLVEKKSIRNITKILKKNINYVKTTQSRGIKRLKELLQTKDFVHP